MICVLLCAVPDFTDDVTVLACSLVEFCNCKSIDNQNECMSELRWMLLHDTHTQVTNERKRNNFVAHLDEDILL